MWKCSVPLKEGIKPVKNLGERVRLLQKCPRADFSQRPFAWSFKIRVKKSSPGHCQEHWDPSSLLSLYKAKLLNVKHRHCVAWLLSPALSAPVTLTCILTYRLLFICSLCLEHSCPFFTDYLSGVCISIPLTVNSLALSPPPNWVRYPFIMLQHCFALFFSPWW